MFLVRGHFTWPRVTSYLPFAMNYTVGSSHHLTFAHSTTVHAIHSNVNKKNLKGTSRHSFENHSKKRGEKEGITHLSKII